MLLTLALVIAWVALATYGDIQFKAASRAYSLTFLVGLLAYASCSFFAIAVFRRQQWGWIIITWNCLSLAISMILSVAVFHEPFTWRRALASALVIAAIVLAE